MTVAYFVEEIIVVEYNILVEKHYSKMVVLLLAYEGMDYNLKQF
jgi:hypothetical protein